MEPPNPATIQPLPPDVIHLIAAAEVIDSPAAVIRELIENALDASATRITLALDLDQWRITVTDNGQGMTLDNLTQAAAPHTTSKIRDRDDLRQVSSLGFRGEALHSLAQLADLQILSRPADTSADTSTGWRITYSPQGQALTSEAVAIAPGTIVIADRLFDTWPARRRGGQHLRDIQTTIETLALCHPQVTWQALKADRDWFRIAPGPSPQQILLQILRQAQAADLVEWQDGTTLQLLLGLPDRLTRPRPDWIKVAINGRFVQAPELEQSIVQAFRRTLPRDRYPLCIVQLQVPPDQVDWHRQPAKTAIYLENLADRQAQITAGIHQALRLESTPQQNQRVGNLLKTAEAAADYRSAGRSLMDLRALAQVHERYILAQHPTGMWLVEQHIAHERVLYEQLLERWQLVPLEPPMVLDQLTVAQVEQLQRIGLDVSEFGEHLWAVRTAPALLQARSDCRSALLELSSGGDLQTAQVATACRSAIRNGTPMTLPEMQKLLDQWQRTQHPQTCPHGRPIYLSLEESSLSRFFRRHWVIGKSHGI